MKPFFRLFPATALHPKCKLQCEPSPFLRWRSLEGSQHQGVRGKNAHNAARAGAAGRHGMAHFMLLARHACIVITYTFIHLYMRVHANHAWHIAGYIYENIDTSMHITYIHIPSRKLTKTLRNGHSKRKLVFQALSDRVFVSLGDGNSFTSCPEPCPLPTAATAPCLARITMHGKSRLPWAPSPSDWNAPQKVGLAIDFPWFSFPRMDQEWSYEHIISTFKCGNWS